MPNAIETICFNAYMFITSYVYISLKLCTILMEFKEFKQIGESSAHSYHVVWHKTSV